MKAFVGVTDREWWGFLRRQDGLAEVNFWQPSGRNTFRALAPGQPFLFKLHYPDNFIVGGGFFGTFSLLPVSLAWRTFGIQNGAGTLQEMRARIERLRRRPADRHEDYTIGCIILVEPFFLDRPDWVPAPADFAPNTVRGKGYDLTTPAGRALWEAVLAARGSGQYEPVGPPPADLHGALSLFRPRLGQGAFRVAVTEAYGRRCAVTGERTLPVLEAAHIRPVAGGGQHEVRNGLLFRSDIHTLFDRGYVTVTRDLRFKVSHRLRADWANGAVYYRLADAPIRAPQQSAIRPDAAALEWHRDTVFLG
jgi:putative restriction endonuclease